MKIVYDCANDIFIMTRTTDWYDIFYTWTYDLKSNNWTDMSPSVQPSHRGGYAFVFDEKKGVAISMGDL